MSPQAGVATDVAIAAAITTHAAIAAAHHTKTTKASEITSEAFADARIPAGVARDAEVATAIGDHAADKDAHHTELSALEFVIDGGGSAISIGEKGYLEVPFVCTILRVSLLADQDGAIKIDIWKDTYANYPPDNNDSICGGNEPEIVASGKEYQDSTLTSWTTALGLGNILAFNVDSCTTIERVVISLVVQKS